MTDLPQTKTMQDGTRAFLNAAKINYIRHEKYVLIPTMDIVKKVVWAHFKSREDYYKNYSEDTDRIVFYTLEGKRIFLTAARCQNCKDFMFCRRLGHFVECLCGASFIDAERWNPTAGRIGGEAKFLRVKYGIRQAHAN